MSAPSCERIDDAAVYVLRAMEDGHWEQYEEHLGACTPCAEKVDELRFVSHALLNAVPQLSAPGELRASIMAIVRGEAELLSAVGVTADRPAADAPRRRTWLGRLRPRPIAALATAVLALGFVGDAILVGGGGVQRHCGSAIGAATACIEQRADSAKLILKNMPAPPEGRIYEVWLSHRNGRVSPTDALFSVRKDGSATVVVPGDLGTVKGVLVTHEPLGGSDVPSMQPIVDVALT